jgi:hypothetical protein
MLHNEVSRLQLFQRRLTILIYLSAFLPLFFLFPSAIDYYFDLPFYPPQLRHFHIYCTLPRAFHAFTLLLTLICSPPLFVFIIVSGNPRSAWELYLKMTSSNESFNLLQLIANDCYRVGRHPVINTVIIPYDEKLLLARLMLHISTILI